MRIGEIAIISPIDTTKCDFIKAASDEIVMQSQDFVFGRIYINSQLMVHLYGLNYNINGPNIPFDLLSKKILGYIVLYNWENNSSYSQIKTILDSLANNYQVPVVIAANLSQNSVPIPQQLINVDFNLSDYCDFAFYRTSDPASVKKVIVILIDSILEKLN